jgi:hypothetical protein
VYRGLQALPPKSVTNQSKVSRKVVRLRQKALEAYLQLLLDDDETAECDVLQSFFTTQHVANVVEQLDVEVIRRSRSHKKSDAQHTTGAAEARVKVKHSAMAKATSWLEGSARVQSIGTTTTDGEAAQQQQQRRPRNNNTNSSKSDTLLLQEPKPPQLQDDDLNVEYDDGSANDDNDEDDEYSVQDKQTVIVEAGERQIAVDAAIDNAQS